MFDFNDLFGLDLSMSKADRLRYGESLMTHAMTFTGFDSGVEEGQIRKWRVENSWADKHGMYGRHCYVIKVLLLFSVVVVVQCLYACAYISLYSGGVLVYMYSGVILVYTSASSLAL